MAKSKSRKGANDGHSKNRTKFAALDRLARDPRVEEIWDEGRNGIWLSLQPGYNFEGTSTLHAERYDFTHPMTGEPLSLVAPLPGDLQQFWEARA